MSAVEVSREILITDVEKRLLRALKEAVRRSILVLFAIGWRGTLFIKPSFSTVADAALAYGYNPTVVKLFSPREVTQAEAVEEWLGWLGRQEAGKSQVERLVSWARGNPIWQMADREECSERTIINRIDRSIAAILLEFGGMDAGLEVVSEEPEKRHKLAFFADEFETATEGVRTNFGKVFIYGIGFMKDGRVLRDGRWKVYGRGIEGDRPR